MRKNPYPEMLRKWRRFTWPSP